MQYEFNFSPDVPTTPYNTEGGLDSSTYSKDGKLISTQRTGFIEVDSGKVDLVKDGEVVDLPDDVVERLEKPQPISQTLFYTQSSVYCDELYLYDENDQPIYDSNGNQISEEICNHPADARNMTNGIYNEPLATGTEFSEFEWVQVDLNGVFDIKGVVVGCDWFGPNQSPYSWDFSAEFPGLGGGWGKGYAENRDVQGSLDGINWETLFNTGSFDRPIQIYSVSTRVRYLRIVANNQYIAITEFYAI